MGRTIKNMEGKVFGLLTVLEFAGYGASGRAKWLCRCECGQEVIVDGANLRCGNSRSCGNAICKMDAKHLEKPMQEKPKVKEKPMGVKKDCFAYVARDGRHLCSAMNEVYCLTGQCKFYAPLTEVCENCQNKACEKCLTVSYQKQLEK